MRLPVLLIALVLVPVAQGGVAGGSVQPGPAADADGDAHFGSQAGPGGVASASQHAEHSRNAETRTIAGPDQTGSSTEPDGDAPGSGVVLWMHGGQDGGHSLYMGTREPAEVQDTSSAEAIGLGSTSACIKDPSGQTQATYRQEHSWYGYLTSSIVEYDVADGQPQYFPPQGLGHDMFLAEAPAQLTWFLETRDLMDAGGVFAPLAVVPGVQVQATLREGDDYRMDHQALREGRVLAHGSSDAVTLHPAVDHPQVEHHMVDGAHVYGFTFDAPPVTDDLRIDPAESFRLQVDVTMDEPVCQEGYTMPDLVRLHGSEGLWSRLHLRAHDVMQVPYLRAERHGDDILIHAEARSAFGAYDTDVTSWRLQVDGPATLELLAANVTQHLYTYERFHDPVSAIWVWENVSQAPDGEYTITFEAHNLQGTAQANRTLVLTLEDDDWTACDTEEPVCTHLKHGDKRSPGSALPLLLAGLAVAVLSSFAAAARGRRRI